MASQAPHQAFKIHLISNKSEQQEQKSSIKMDGTKSQRHERNGSAKESVSCISKDLYDEPPQSDFIFIQIYYNILHASLKFMSIFCLGQAVITILDYYMIKIINTLDFCVPDSPEFADQKVIERHKKSLPIKARPMSWLLFIPALIFLRMLRFIFSVWNIIFGKGEVTAQQMQSKVIAFRRYYRSIRHFAVTTRWNDESLKSMESRKQWRMWRIYYQIYEIIFMVRPLVESHPHAYKNGNSSQVTTNGNGYHKETLNVSSDSESDEDLNSNQLLNKYGNMNDSLTADPDYMPAESVTDGDSIDSDFSSDSDEEKTESQRKLNDDYVPDETEITSGYACSSDIDKSNDTNSQWLSDEKTLEKISKILEDVETASLRSSHDDIFYSPIGSPPELNAAARGYNSDTELHNNQENISNEQ